MGQNEIARAMLEESDALLIEAKQTHGKLEAMDEGPEKVKLEESIRELVQRSQQLSEDAQKILAK